MITQCARCGKQKTAEGWSDHPSYCLECRRALGRVYDNNPKRKAQKAQTSHEWGKRNRQHQAQYKKQRLANPVTGETDRASARIRSKRYYSKNRQKCFDHAARRRARMHGAYEEKVDRLEIAERDSWTCHICGKKVSRDDMSLDHLIPIVSGGKHCATNVRLAHLTCNKRRGAGLIPAQLLLL